MIEKLGLFVNRTVSIKKKDMKSYFKSKELLFDRHFGKLTQFLKFFCSVYNEISREEQFHDFCGLLKLYKHIIKDALPKRY